MAKTDNAIALERIDVDPANPRQDLGDLTELAASIREQGVLQPILIRPKGDRYLLVAGRRRFAAAKRNRLESIPAVVREMTDQEAAIASLVENLQREDLAPLEEAEAYRKIIEVTGWTQDQLAEHVHKSRPIITNALRILEAPEAIREAVRGGLAPNNALIAMTIADPSLAVRLKLRRGITRPEIEQQVVTLNAEWRRGGPGAEAEARKVLAATATANPKAIVTWPGEPEGQRWLGLDFRKSLGKPPAPIVGHLDRDGAAGIKQHDRLCPCRAWAVAQGMDGMAGVRVCIDATGWRRYQRENAPARERAKARHTAEADARRRAIRVLEPEVRKARFAPIRRRLTRGGLEGEPARLVAFELGRRGLSPAGELALWGQIAKLPLPKVRTLTLDLAANDLAPIALARGRPSRPAAAVLEHYGVRREVARAR